MVLKELILTVSTLGGCGSERTDFNRRVWLLKELILTVFTLGVCGQLKELILTVSTLRGCGSFERTDFNSFYLWGGVWQS